MNNPVPNVILENHPWDYNLEVKRIEYKSIHGFHNTHGVIVSPNADPFPLPDSNAEIAIADQQVNLYFLKGIYGSGRSIFYRGKYLKGTGITPLCNITRTDDSRYHSSGHLLPSGAIREYLVSLYLESLGCVSAIVPCEDVFLRCSSSSLQEMTRKTVNSLTKNTKQPLPLDISNQAVSLKPGNFARYTNILWLIGNEKDLSTSREFIDVLSLIGFYSKTPNMRVEGNILDVVVDEVIDSLHAGLLNGFKNILHTNLLGIKWGSLNNNFTLDGRYLDLETAAILGGFQIGCFKQDSNKVIERADYAGSFECLSYVRQMRSFIQSLESFSIYLENRFVKQKLGKVHVRSAKNLLAGIKNIRKTCVLFKNEKLKKIVLENVLNNAQLERNNNGSFRKIFGDVFDEMMVDQFRGKPFAARKSELPFQMPEYCLDDFFYVNDKFKFKNQNLDDVVFFNDCYNSVLKCEKADDALSLLGAMREKFREKFKPRKIDIEI